MTYFKDFIEDYNTATMPHEKYYNYEVWEMNEYRKAQLNKINKTGAIINFFSIKSNTFFILLAVWESNIRTVTAGQYKKVGNFIEQEEVE